MSIMIIYNAIGFEIDKYNLILLYKLWNITDYIYLFLVYEIIIGVTPTGLADKILCVPIQSLHQTVHICTFFIISMSLSC